jgi:hypothetical protein
MIDREPDVPQERRIRFRIGVNLGDVIVEEHDIFGNGVNVAARLRPTYPVILLSFCESITMKPTIFAAHESKSLFPNRQFDPPRSSVHRPPLR